MLLGYFLGKQDVVRGGVIGDATYDDYPRPRVHVGALI